MLTAIAAGLPFLSPIFGSHMVLQRDRPNPVWGWTTPGAEVRVRLGKAAAVAKADPKGRWQATLPALPSGGPYEMEVVGPTRQTLEDIWLGEVWLCGGQSNMEFGLTQTKNAKEAITNADRPGIRLFMVDRKVSREPETTLGGTWKVCTPKSVTEGGWGGFSGVAYHFGVELHEKLKVPIGLIQAAWGGTSGEAWTGAEALAGTGDFRADLEMLARETAEGKPELGTYLERWIAANDPGTMGVPPWSAEDIRPDGWNPANLPAAIKEKEVAWFRSEFDWDGIAPAQAELHLGQVAGMDVTFVNGEQVGAGSGEWERAYFFPGSLLRRGKNVLAVRIAYTYGAGGMRSPAGDIWIRAGGDRLPIGDQMKMRLGVRAQNGNEPHDWEANPTVPTLLRNGMIAPIAPLSMRGVIWYQGETNMGRGVQYGRILPALIRDWRRLFGNPDLGFHIVSLANWQPRQSEPVQEYMPELREAQAATAWKIKNTGIAMAYDLGDPVDIHPPDKASLGHRLALCAEALSYGMKIEWTGPVFEKASREGRKLRIRFSHVTGGLVAREGLTGFMVAGSDRVWHWAQAKIDGETVLVECKEVPLPEAVRYAWQNNPPASLYNGAGLPAVPFRSDNWPLLSEHNL